MICPVFLDSQADIQKWVRLYLNLQYIQFLGKFKIEPKKKKTQKVDLKMFLSSHQDERVPDPHFQRVRGSAKPGYSLGISWGYTGWWERPKALNLPSTFLLGIVYGILRVFTPQFLQLKLTFSHSSNCNTISFQSQKEINLDL